MKCRLASVQLWSDSLIHSYLHTCILEVLVSYQYYLQYTSLLIKLFNFLTDLFSCSSVISASLGTGRSLFSLGTWREKGRRVTLVNIIQKGSVRSLLDLCLPSFIMVDETVENSCRLFCWVCNDKYNSVRVLILTFRHYL